MSNRRVRVNGQFTPEWGDIVVRGNGIWVLLKPDNGKFLRSNGVGVEPSWESAGGGSPTWGSITGTLSAQTDLDTALTARELISNKDTDGTLTANSDTKYASQKATKTYADGKVANDLTASTTVAPSKSAVNTALALKEDLANKDTDGTLSANSDTKYASQKAVKTYVDGLVNNIVRLIGGYDASSNLFPSTGGSGVAGAILKGDSWIITVGGTLGSQTVVAGDTIIARVNSPAQTEGNWNILETNISYVPEDVANKDTDGTLSANSDTRYASQKATKTYADSKVIDSIADSDTTHAPSRNAVFDALALKADDSLALHKAGAENITGAKSFDDSTLVLKGATSGTATLKAIAIAGTSVITLPDATGKLVARDSTDTLTNKRITKRASTEASNTTPSVNTDNIDYHSITALAGNITNYTVTGTPTPAQNFQASFLDNGSARTIVWDATKFEDGAVTLPTTTVASTRLDVFFQWNEFSSKFRCMAKG